jgi:hypothetical protein
MKTCAALYMMAYNLDFLHSAYNAQRTIVFQNWSYSSKQLGRWSSNFFETAENSNAEYKFIIPAKTSWCIARATEMPILNVLLLRMLHMPCSADNFFFHSFQDVKGIVWPAIINLFCPRWKNVSITIRMTIDIIILLNTWCSWLKPHACR